MSAAFKDPKFVQMFEEYAKAISDPEVFGAFVCLCASCTLLKGDSPLCARPTHPDKKHPYTQQAKAEAEAYLREVEAEGRDEQVYGAGTTLLAPSPAFAIQTRAAAGAAAADADAEAFVVNVCSCAKVAPMVQQQDVDGGAVVGGSVVRVRVDIPICLGREQKQQRHQLSDNGSSAGGGAQGHAAAAAVSRVWDAVVHPSTAERAADSDAVRDALVDSVRCFCCLRSCVLLQLASYTCACKSGC
jgi:dynein assembly factor 2